jgi:hypothetical protein
MFKVERKRRSANHGFLTSPGGIIFEAFAVALSFSIVPFEKLTESAVMLRFASILALTMSILPFN